MPRMVLDSGRRAPVRRKPGPPDDGGLQPSKKRGPGGGTLQRSKRRGSGTGKKIVSPNPKRVAPLSRVTSRVTRTPTPKSAVAGRNVGVTLPRTSKAELATMVKGVTPAFGGKSRNAGIIAGAPKARPTSGGTPVASTARVTSPVPAPTTAITPRPAPNPNAPVTVTNPNPRGADQYNVRGRGRARGYNASRRGGPRSGLSLTPAELRRIAARRLGG